MLQSSLLLLHKLQADLAKVFYTRLLTFLTAFQFMQGNSLRMKTLSNLLEIISVSDLHELPLLLNC